MRGRRCRGGGGGGAGREGGGEGAILDWIKDNRNQRVVINGINFDSIPVSPGVPQGSVLGPILFLAYINDLPGQVRSRAGLFADNMVMYLAITSLTESIILQEDLLTLEQWDKSRDMNFNPSKCEAYVLPGQNNKSCPSISSMALNWKVSLLQNTSGS